MVFKQKKNANEVTIEILSNGINYSLSDKTIKKNEFIPFENITNETYEFYESNDSFKNNSIYTGIIGILFLSINIIYQTRLWAWIFLLAAPIFLYLFWRSKVSYLVLTVDGKTDIFIVMDSDYKSIQNRIISERNIFLKKTYCKIDFSNDRSEEIKKFKWLYNLGVITENEFVVITEELSN